MGLLTKVKIMLAGGTSSIVDVRNEGLAPDALLLDGARLTDLGRPDEALHCYEQALAIDPTLAIAQFNRGIVLMELGRPQLAIDAFNTALKHKPQSSGTHYNLGNAHLALGDLAGAIDAYKTAISFKPDFTDAKIALEQAQKQAPAYVEHCFQQAVGYQDSHQLDEAERLYLKIITLAPLNAEVYNNLGGLLFRKGNVIDAVSYFRKAICLSPDIADIHNNLGNAYKFLKQNAEALSCYMQSVRLNPNDFHSWLELGNIQRELGHYNDALNSYAHSTQINPDIAETHLNKGVTLVAMNNYDSAELCYLRAIELQSGNAVAYSNLGVVLKQRGNMIDALKYFNKAISLWPDYADAHLNAGTVLQGLGQFDNASAAYKQALSLNPQSAEAHSNYGTLLQQLDRLNEAESSYLLALGINPELATANNNLGIVCSCTRRMSQAVQYYEKAIKIKPDYAEAYANLGGVLKDIGRLDDSLTTLRHALTIDPSCLIAHNNLLFISNYVADQSADKLLAAAKNYGDEVRRRAKPYRNWLNTPDPSRTLRIGIVSGDLSSHPVGYFLDGVLNALSVKTSRQLDIYAYPCHSNSDRTSDKLRSYCKAWSNVVGVSDEEFARKIHDEDVIDILIDLSGHTANNRLPVFGWKAAPVQLSWIGYFATTGLDTVDYFIADPWTLPVDQEANFTERIWRLPETRLCFTPPDTDIEVNPLPALSKGFITFGCFNNLSKMNNEVVAAWSLILKSVPFSQLFLKYQQLSDAAVRQDTLRRFTNHGVAADRLIFEDYAPRSSYLESYHRVDIALDPFPFPGGTTTVEALWMGVPVLTLSGQRFLSRQGVGLLSNAGLFDWVAADMTDYVDRAVIHAGDIRRLATLRKNLRQQVLSSPIFDAVKFAAHFEAALRSMWLNWCIERKIISDLSDEV